LIIAQNFLILRTWVGAVSCLKYSLQCHKWIVYTATEPPSTYLHCDRWWWESGRPGINVRFLQWCHFFFLICLTEASLSGNEASKLQPFLSCHFEIQCTIVIYEGALPHIHNMNLVMSILQVHRTSTKLFGIQGSKLWPWTVWHKKSYTCNMDMAAQPRWRGCSCWFCHSV